MDRAKIENIILSNLNIHFQDIYDTPDKKLGGIRFIKQTYNSYSRELNLFLHYSNGPEMFDRVDMNRISEDFEKWKDKVKYFYDDDLKDFDFSIGKNLSESENRRFFLEMTQKLKSKIDETMDIVEKIEYNFTRSTYSKELEPVINLLGDYIKKLENLKEKVIEISKSVPLKG